MLFVNAFSRDSNGHQSHIPKKKKKKGTVQTLLSKPLLNLNFTRQNSTTTTYRNATFKRQNVSVRVKS